MSREHDLTDALVALEACLGVATMAMAVTEDEGALTALNTIAATIATAHHAVEAKLGDATARQEPQRPVYATMGQDAADPAEAPQTPPCEHERWIADGEGNRMCRACGEDPFA